MLWTGAFWKATAERVIASFVGAVLAFWGVAALPGTPTDVTTLDFGLALKVGAGAALFSLLKAVLAATTGGGPSLTNAETLTPAVAAVKPAEVGEVASSEFEAGPAAHVPEGEPVTVEPTSQGYEGRHEDG